jgi:hypothetical protein
MLLYAINFDITSITYLQGHVYFASSSWFFVIRFHEVNLRLHQSRVSMFRPLDIYTGPSLPKSTYVVFFFVG